MTPRRGSHIVSIKLSSVFSHAVWPAFGSKPSSHLSHLPCVPAASAAQLTQPSCKTVGSKPSAQGVQLGPTSISLEQASVVGMKRYQRKQSIMLSTVAPAGGCRGGGGGRGARGWEGVVLEGEVRTATAGARVRGEQSAERGARSADRLQREAAAVAAAVAAAAAALRHKRRPGRA